MLPLCHTYVSINAAGKKTPLLILGSILPDIATTSSQQIGRDQIHNSPREFYTFVSEKYPQLVDLALGVRLHSQVDGGADFFSDDKEVGYAYLEGKKLSAEVAVLLGIPDGNISLVLAHNFIEMASDLHLYEDNRAIWDTYKEGLTSVEKDLQEVSQCLSDYLKLDQETVLTETHRLISFLGPDNLVSAETVIKNLALPLIKLKFKTDVSFEDTLRIGLKALDITKPTYKAYLENAVVQVKKNILNI